MAKSYCVKEKRQTDCVPGSETTVRAKNGRLMMKCKCASCGITKTKFMKGNQLGPLKYHNSSICRTYSSIYG